MNGTVARAPVLRKFYNTLKEFAKGAPAPRDLLASRRQSFERLHVIIPSDAVAGERTEITVLAWDGHERLYRDLDECFAVTSTDEAAIYPETVRFSKTNNAGIVRETVTFHSPGIQYLILEGSGDRQWISNPITVHHDDPDERIYWGDLHLHSQYSDGTGSMEKGFRFGRDVMDLDVVAYTDHDTMGFFIPPALQRRRMRERYFDAMKTTTNAFNDPGTFVTLFGYEYTKQPTVGGHINVYYEEPNDAELFDSMSTETSTYESLWKALRNWRDRTGSRVLTVPHHTAEATYPFDFSSMDYDDEMAPLVEIYSQWGASDRPSASGNPYPVAMGAGEVTDPGHHFEDALALGNKVGAMASSDYHGPRPGHSILHAKPHLPSWTEWREDGLGWASIWRIWNERSYPGGLVAIRSKELTRNGIFDALADRAVYGTTQPHRILVNFDIDGVRPGDENSTRTLEQSMERTICVSVAGTAPIERVVIVKNNEVLRALDGTTDPTAGLETYQLSTTFVDNRPITGMSYDEKRGVNADVYYVRVIQTANRKSTDNRPANRGMAWAGPVWVES